MVVPFFQFDLLPWAGFSLLLLQSILRWLYSCRLWLVTGRVIGIGTLSTSFPSLSSLGSCHGFMNYSPVYDGEGGGTLGAGKPDGPGSVVVSLFATQRPAARW